MLVVPADFHCNYLKRITDITIVKNHKSVIFKEADFHSRCSKGAIKDITMAKNHKSVIFKEAECAVQVPQRRQHFSSMV